MDINLLVTFKNKLAAVKETLIRQIARLNKPVDMGDDTDSFDEETDEAVEFSANAGMVDSLKRRARRVDDALLKIAKGVYGVCEKCHGEIEPKLLGIDPESRHCRECKLKMQK